MNTKIKSKPVWKHFEDSVIEQGTVPESPHDYINLIALGRTGDGKSSLLNDLLGQQVFKQKISAKV